MHDSAFIGFRRNASATMVANLPSIGSNSMDTLPTYVRRTTNIISLDLKRIAGGPPRSLSPTLRGFRSALGQAGNLLSLGMKFTKRLVIDAGFTIAEAIGCSIYEWGILVPHLIFSR